MAGRKEAEHLLEKAGMQNPGSWTAHSRNVAVLAERIAAKAGMDDTRAYVFGLLHDIGRQYGPMQARHALEGYRFLMEQGYPEEARICMTHTFQYQNPDAVYDSWDCSEEELDWVRWYLSQVTYDDYDRLIQLCDALSLADGYCIAEKKMVSSILKFGWKDTTEAKWKAILCLKEYFDNKINGDVYALF